MLRGYNNEERNKDVDSKTRAAVAVKDEEEALTATMTSTRGLPTTLSRDRLAHGMSPDIASSVSASSFVCEPGARPSVAYTQIKVRKRGW